MKALRNFLLALVMFGFCSVTLAADFEEDFESYATGNQIHGQGGWAGWDGAISAGALVSDTYAYSGTQSVEILPTSDLVQQFDAAGGRWIYKTMMYIPSGGTGTTWFIMLNTYTEGGDPKDWSIQTQFNESTGEITSSYVGGTFDIIYDQWVELTMDIDLENNTVDEYYDGQLIFTHQWDDNNHGTLQCVDLYGNSASSVYYDDITLVDVRSLAGDPYPADASSDAARDAILTWTPGSHAVTHDVYLGTDYDTVATASRANPMGVLISQDQTEAVYEMGDPLELETVYYWRVDEIRKDGTIDKGFVWSFTTEPRLYTLENVSVVTSGVVLADQEPENIVNGSGLDADGQHSTDTMDMWLTDFVQGLMFVQFTFDEPVKLYEMEVWNHNFIFEAALGLGAKDVTVDYSANGSQWTTLGDVVFAQGTGLPTYTANTTVDFGGILAKFVRLTIHSNYSGGNQVGLSEVRFLYLPVKARYPVPANGATNVPVAGTVLRWRESRGAMSHGLYLSTNRNRLDLAGTTTENSYEPGGLDLDTTYFWRVDEVNEADAVSVWAGDTWSFATQEYIVIDDFDSYVDDESEGGQAIWSAWIDGLVEYGGDAANGGSQVGHDASPFAEQTIVHTGSQSMPLYFNNASASAISEADKNFATAQDWMGHAIKSLSLWYYGSSDNSGHLYVKINDTKVVLDSDITRTQWLPWNIDLTASGANLGDVTTLTVGVEGVGSGVVYIDDIRLYAKSPQTVIPIEPDSADIVAYYALNGNANDSSGHGYNGTATGGYLYVAGVNGQALDVDGVSGYVDITNATDWPSGRAPRTMSAWLMSRSVDSGYRFAVAYGTGAGSQAMFIGMNGARFYGGGYGNDVSIGNYFVIDEWFHCCLTYDGTTARLYGNGLEVASAAKTWNLVLNQARIGQQVNANSEFWDGAIDDVYVYNKALSAGEVAHLAGRTGVVHLPF